MFYELGYTTGIILFIIIAVVALFWFFKLILLLFALNFLSKTKRNTENLYREQKKTNEKLDMIYLSLLQKGVSTAETEKTASDEKEKQEVEP